MTSSATSNDGGNGRTNGPLKDAGTGTGTDTAPIRSLVNRTRRLLRSTWVMTGLFATLGLGLLLLVTATMTDFVVSTAAPSPWTGLRLIGLLVLVVPTTWALVVGVLKPLFRRLSAVLVARRIETELPAIHNRLVTCIDLEDAESHVPVSLAFHRRLVSEAIERIRGFHPWQVLDIRNLRRAGLIAAVGLLALGVVFVPSVRTAMARVFSPFSDIPPSGHASYVVMVGNDKQLSVGDGFVVRGDDVIFLVTLQDGQLREDERLVLVIETTNDEGDPVTIRHALPDFEHTPKLVAQLRLKGLENTFHYRVTGGGTYSRRYSVEMLARPEIVRVGTVLSYPEYMKMPDHFSDVADVEGPVGSQVTVTVVTEGNVAEKNSEEMKGAWIEFLEYRNRRQSVADRRPREWFSSERPRGSAASGTWQVESLRGRDGHTDPANAAVHAHGFEKAPDAFEVRIGEVLYADVYLPPNQLPRQIMLKWHDGTDWEQRAYWGEDLIGEGVPGTASRYHAGALPATGRLVRLEVPASVLGLEGRSITGMLFTLHGGQAIWSGSGAALPAQETIRELVSAGSPVWLTRRRRAADDGLGPGQSAYFGTFPLQQNGLYRIQLCNRAGERNKQMAEARIVAIPDHPPQVVIERPGQTLLLSGGQPVPISITAYDDFGVHEIVLSVRTADQDQFTTHKFELVNPPRQSDRRDVILDADQFDLKTGDTLTYRVEVRDGKGQAGQTIDYVIQIKNDDTAVDKQFDKIEQQSDVFRDKFIELVAQQKKVQTKVQELKAKYRPLTDKIEKAQFEAVKQQQKDAADPTKTKKDKPVDPAQPPPPVKLTPEEQKRLDELKNALKELATEEAKNVALSVQVQADLKNLAEQVEKNQLVPPQIAEQMQRLQEAFQQAAVDPLKQLQQQMQQAVTPQQQNPQLPQMQRQADRVQKDLEVMKKRMDALARAQRDSRQDFRQAMANLRKDLLEQNAELTRDALEDLKDYLKAMEQDLKNLMGKQENLLKTKPSDVEQLRKFQEQLQQELEKMADEDLDRTAELLNTRRMRQPFFPGRPYSPEDKAYRIPPKEKDTDPTPEEEKAALEKALKDLKNKKGKKDKKKDDDEDPEEEFFIPALGGLRAELDPRFAEMMRNVQRRLMQQQKKKGEPGEPEEVNRKQQVQRLQELDLARKALQADQQSLQQMQQQLQQAQQQSQQQSQPQSQQQQGLQQMMQNAMMQQARRMMQRMQQQQNPQQSEQQAQQKQKKSQPQPMSKSKSLVGNLQPDGQGTDQVLVDLGEFDIAMRRVIMKMQPREREVLLQGLREEGPEAYRGFIRDYFQKLSRARAVKKPGK